MVDSNEVQRLLTLMTSVLKESGLWLEQLPHESVFISQEPFCLDTMTAQQWLQWVFIPKMVLLIENQQPLPARLALTPYFEEALPEEKELITLLQQLDLLFN